MSFFNNLKNGIIPNIFTIILFSLLFVWLRSVFVLVSHLFLISSNVLSLSLLIDLTHLFITSVAIYTLVQAPKYAWPISLLQTLLIFFISISTFSFFIKPLSDVLFHDPYLKVNIIVFFMVISEIAKTFWLYFKFNRSH